MIRGFQSGLAVKGLAVLALALTMGVAVLKPSPASAQDSYCENMWYQRNLIFASRGYCFKSAKGQAAFPNSCFPPFGKLSAVERKLVNLIKTLEAQNGCGSAAQPASAKRVVPIIIGGNDYDACGSSGEVAGLKASGDGFLAVRAAPDGAKVDEVYNGQQVYLCNSIGDWLGVVYPAPGQDPAACNVSTPWQTPQQYVGPCRYGWVFRSYVRIVAG